MGMRQTCEGGLLTRANGGRGSVAGLALGIALMLCGPVAVASAEAPCPNEQFRTGPSAGLPDCRAYELVSPANKQRGEVDFPAWILGTASPAAITGPALDGDHFMYASFQAFAETPNAVLSTYVATRGASGWASANISPTPTAKHPWLYNSITGVIDATGDFSHAIVTAAGLDPLDQRTPPGVATGIFDLYVRQPDGSFTWASRGNEETPETETAEPEISYAGRSADFSHVLFETPLKLVPAGSGQEAGNALYDRVNGHTELVNVNSEGALLNTCGATIGGQRETYKAVSEDGSRTFFTTPDPGQSFNFEVSDCQLPAQLYMREAGRTVQISKSQRTVPDPAGTQPAYFQEASSDGSKVFFTSTEALTDEAQPGSAASPLLYEYDTASGHLKLLTPNQGTTSPSVAGVSAISADGSHVYFVDDITTGETSTPTLEMYAEGHITPIASVPLGAVGLQGAVGLAGGENEGARPVRLSADGLHLAFEARDNVTGFDSHGHQEIYLYDASTNALRCVSCNSDGHVPLGEADFSSDIIPDSYRRHPLPVNVTANGSHVFFETPDYLVPQDENGAMDVYEWVGGRDYLISGGHGASGSYFTGSAEEGHDVFFTTTDGLVSQDTDNGDTDVYDARMGGGFAQPVSATAGCSGDGCQAPPSPPPLLAAVGSATLQGQGNLAIQSHPATPKRKPKRHKHKRRRPKHRAKSGRQGNSAVNHGKSRSAGR
jgi:hypothetical protein